MKNKTYLKIKRDEDGRWIAYSVPRTRPQVVIVGLFFIAYLICYMIYGYPAIASGAGTMDSEIGTRSTGANIGTIQRNGEGGIRVSNEASTGSNPASDFCEGIPYIGCKGKESHQESRKAEREGEASLHFQATVTGYTSHAAQTDSTPCIAADGSDICKRYARGEKICATNDWKMGTKLTIEGLGTCTVADRMNKRYTGTGRVDWYFGYDIESARKHGIKNLFVEAE